MKILVLIAIGLFIVWAVKKSIKNYDEFRN